MMKLIRISEIPIFSGFPQAELNLLESILVPRIVVQGEVIFLEGDIGDSLSIVLSGQVEVVKSLGTVQERLLAVLGPGEFIGEMSLLFPDQPRSASVRARTEVELRVISQKDFNELIQRQPDLAFHILKALSMRMRASQEATIHDLNERNRQLALAYEELKLAQQRVIEQEKMEHELRMARRIQESILPKEFPELSGWRINAHWQPARQVSGDFYDFLPLSDDFLAIVVGDVTDKGMPAALVMAVTRTVIRMAAASGANNADFSPSTVLTSVNKIMVPDMPQSMFVTCLYAVLELSTGILRYSNAGHNLPLHCSINGVEELHARGMPLGLLPQSFYEEKVSIIDPGDKIMIYSDGITEAHNRAGEMFGISRLKGNLLEFRNSSVGTNKTDVTAFLVACLENFAGENWEQEDDVTFVTLDRS